jgi:hypothetical protein
MWGPYLIAGLCVSAIGLVLGALAVHGDPARGQPAAARAAGTTCTGRTAALRVGEGQCGRIRGTCVMTAKSPEGYEDEPEAGERFMKALRCAPEPRQVRTLDTPTQPKSTGQSTPLNRGHERQSDTICRMR